MSSLISALVSTLVSPLDVVWRIWCHLLSSPSNVMSSVISVSQSNVILYVKCHLLRRPCNPGHLLVSSHVCVIIPYHWPLSSSLSMSTITSCSQHHLSFNSSNQFIYQLSLCQSHNLLHSPCQVTSTDLCATITGPSVWPESTPNYP